MIDRNRFFSSRRQACAVVILLVGLFASGCGKLVQELGEVSKLHAALVKEFGEKDLGVNINNNTVLTVSFVNSPLNDKGSEERARRAEQTAAFVKKHYSSIEKLNAIWVVFVRSQTHFIFFHYSETVSVFGFDKDGQPLRSPDAPPSSAPDHSLRATATYSPTANQTEVAIWGLQLQGTLDQGLTVSPHFALPGDVTGVRRSEVPPKAVIFDFASYSEKSLFPGEPKIKFLADGKVAFETAEQFSTSKNADGLFTELLKLEVPYPAFRRFTTGKKLTLMLGDNEYKLTDAQAEALRQMTEYVRD